MEETKGIQSAGLFLIIDHANLKGLKHWTEELDQRKIPAVIQSNMTMFTQHADIIRDLTRKGFEICGAYNEKPFWGEPYAFQYEVMRQVKEKVETCTGKPMCIFGSKYSAYDETTLMVAEKLGIPYLFGRGAMGTRAVVFKPEEYGVIIISVSNIHSKQLGTGSLCDQSLWSRGASPEDLRETLFSLKEDRIVLVAQTHLSGVKLHWWKAYQEFLDANKVIWRGLSEFTENPLVLPNSKIPMNTEVQYAVPQPKVPLEEETDYPFSDG